MDDLKTQQVRVGFLKNIYLAVLGLTGGTQA